MSIINIHDEWLSLLDISGTFLAPPVLKEAYPQGLDALDGLKRKRLRQTYEEWNESYLAGEKEFPKIHEAWIKEVLLNCLDYGHGGGQFLKLGQDIPASLHCPITEYGVTLLPEYALVDSQREKPNLLLIQSYSRDIDLNKLIKYEHYSATPVDQMVQLCRASQCRLGLVTNGENWFLIDAPVGSMSTSAGWQGRYWVSEAITLQSFVHLLGISRFFVSKEDQVPALIDRSLQYQDEVTSALGTQIQRAIEVLIQSLDKYDLESGRTLLHGVTESELYEAALTVMMRLVFLLSAEERGLLLLDDGAYQKNYALSTLRMQLRQESDEILERRWDAWSRLLALFRMVYGGVEHENFRLPALGGSLFDPDRFAFLEGREKGSNWKVDQAKPLPIDNRTVLLLLEAIQQFEGRTLSYRSLDVEQIGYVYEGLLERTVKRTSEIILDVGATRSAEKPLVALNELEAMRQGGDGVLEAFLVERSGSSLSRIRNDLSKPVDERLFEKLLTACAGDPTLRDQIKHYANLLRNDSWGYPLVYPAGSYVVTTGSDRRETGSHYTPKTLTEVIVAETLTPIVYVGPAEGLPRERWKLKSPEQILDLKICDPAMGSGAFLVQVCRWLSDRLIDSWANAETEGLLITSEGQTKKSNEVFELMPPDLEARIVIARRLIAERCLYGVDINPLAVELAKLSIWLITMSKGRPFGFLDHNLKHGDSLLGLKNIEQLIDLSMNPSDRTQQRLFGKNIRALVNDAIELRKNLRSQPIRNIHDIELVTRLDAEARDKLSLPNIIANAFVGSIFMAAGNSLSIAAASEDLSIKAGRAIEGELLAIEELRRLSNIGLAFDLPVVRYSRHPFHWPLEFPEVFQSVKKGFDSIIGNPPFLGGTRITGVFGSAYREWLVAYIAGDRRGSADFVTYFFLRSWDLISNGGNFGLLAVNTISEGDTRQVGLESMLSTGAAIYAAYPNEPWPGKASVITSRVHIYKGDWHGIRSLSGQPALFISAFLTDREEWSPKRLKANNDIAYTGSYVSGMGFVLPPEDAKRMLDDDPKNSDVIYLYMNGENLNSDPLQKPNRWVINFWDWPEERAKKYELPYQWTKEFVKPERSQNNRKERRERWWLFAEKAPALNHAIGRGHFFEKHPNGWLPERALKPQSIIGTTLTSKHRAFSFLPVDAIFDQTIIVFTKVDLYTVLNSNLHLAWASSKGGSLGTGPRYIQTDCFETFPFPNRLNEELNSYGVRLHEMRHHIMQKNEIGLTKLYNRFHSRKELGEDMEALRILQCEIDFAVLQAYGWDDIKLEHNFFEVPYLPVNDRVRYTISEVARIELLGRLADLNRHRYDEEKEKISSGDSMSSIVPRSKRVGTATIVSPTQTQLDI